MPTSADLFGCNCALVGMVHVQPLPGTAASSRTISQIASIAADEARTLTQHGCDALIIENMHDAPYLRRHVGPEIIAAMTAIARSVRDAVDVPLGVQILAGANEAALAVALACEACFIRAEGFVFASIADEGLLDEADAGPLLRYRRHIGADHIAILADVKKKHASHAITADVDLGQTVHAAAFFRADGIIITGTATGEPVDLTDLAAARQATALPLIVGSGAAPDSAAALLTHADALIVGSALKQAGRWANPPDAERIEAMAAAVRACR